MDVQGNFRHDDVAPFLRNLVEVITGDGNQPANSSRTPSKTPPKRRVSEVALTQDEAGETLQEAYLWTQPALAEIASLLLNLVYELCGTCSSAQYAKMQMCSVLSHQCLLKIEVECVFNTSAT